MTKTTFTPLAEKKEYNYGIELFRVFSMVLIIILHLNLMGGLMGCFPEISDKYMTVWFGESFSFCCVNCYALISGYVMYYKKPTCEKLLKTWFQVFSISATCAVIFLIINDPAIPLKKITDCFFPLTKAQYWYFVAYFGMYLLTPILNAGIEKMDKKAHKSLCFIIFIFFTILPISVSNDLFRHSNGSSTFWLCLMYIIGSYFGKYGVKTPKFSAWKCFTGAIISGILLAVWVIYHSYTKSLETGAPAEQFKVLFYTNPLCVLQSILFLMGFSQLKFNNTTVKKVIKWLGASSFSVYLIHVNPLVFDIWFSGSAKFLSNYNFFVMAILVILVAIGLYIACTIIDKIRLFILKLLQTDKIIKYFSEFVEVIFDSFLKLF